ncbi:TIGR04222 domain-containing membrane protein [Kitasatospora sp. NPDC056446]|uniref:TIGR04222 domain-containing membrane protein n=1 Tax=Kitasatospora sp. NPDC056446 TaxID=3345819 RepID=UPI00368B83C0
MWLVLVLLLGVGAAVAVAAVRCHVGQRDLRRAERLADGREFDLEPIELAFLAGNLGALTVTEMYEGGRLIASRSGEVTLTTPGAARTGTGAGAGAAAGDGAGDGFEAVVVRSLGSALTGDLKTLLRAVDGSPEAKALRARLAAHGLADDEELVERVRRVNRRTPVLIGAVAVACAVAGAWTGTHRGLWPTPPAVSLLAAFLVPFAAALWINQVSWPPLRSATAPGERVLEAARGAEVRQGTMTVALWGLTALPAGHDLRTCDAATRVLRKVKRARQQRRRYQCGGGIGCGV